ncbi:Uncharacterized protein Fot_41364 [Forsythia ovata]|uniref:Uncharacterized protein n=1 Tax=Forsythia ovata TaxID=205694 RepID=A0ABD1RI18_9LAMI
MKEAKAAIDALDESPLMISTVQDQSPNLKIHQEIDDFNKEAVNNEQISSFSFFSMENGATPPLSTEFQAYPHDEFNSILYPSYQEGIPPYNYSAILFYNLYFIIPTSNELFHEKLQAQAIKKQINNDLLNKIVKVHAKIDAQQPLIRNHVCFFATIVVKDVFVSHQELMETKNVVRATTISRQKKADQNALENANY